MTPDRTPLAVSDSSDLFLLSAAANLAVRATSRQDLLTGSLDLIQTALGAPGGLIRLLDTEAKDLVLAAARGVPERYLETYPRIPLGERLSGRAARDGRPLILSDGDRTNPVLRSLRAEGLDVTEVACIPLQAWRSLVGVMILYRTEGHPFTEPEVALLSTLGQHLGVVLETRRLLEESREQQERFKTLTQFTSNLTSHLDPQAVCDSIAKAAVELLHTTYARLWLMDPLTRKLSVASAYGLPGFSAEELKDVRIPEGEGITGRIIQEKKPLFLSDVHESTKWKFPEFIEQIGAVSFGGIPLMVEGEVLGVLAVFSRTYRSFSPEERELLTLFCGQAAIAIKNARLFREVLRGRTHAEALREIGLSLTTTHDPQNVLERIAEEARRLTGALFTFVVVPDTPFYRFAAVAGDDQGYRNLLKLSDDPTSPYGQGPLGRAIRSRRPVICEDVLTDPLFVPWREMAAARGIRSLVAVPLVVQEKPYCALLIYSPVPRAYDAETLDLLTSLAAQGAVAIESVRLLQETEQRASELAIFHAAASTFNQSQDFARTLKAVLDVILTSIRADAASIRLLNAAGNQIEHTINKGFSEEYLTERSGINDIGPAARQVLSTGEVVLAPDLEQDPLFQKGMLVRAGYRSAIYVPITAKGRILGVFHLVSRTRQQFTQRERDVLVSIGYQLGAALENARLFQETVRRAREQAALHTVTAAVSASLDLEQVLEKALNAVLDVSGMEIGYIQFLEGEPPRLTLKVHRGVSPAFVAKLQRGMRPGGKAEKILATQQPILSENIPADHTGKFHGEGITAAAWIPITSEQKVMGIITVATRRTHTFPREQLPLLESIGAALGVALERTRLYAETVRRAREQAALHTVTAAVSSSLDVEQILGKALDTILEVTGLEAGSIRLLEGEPPRLTIKVHRGISPAFREKLQGGTRPGGKAEQVISTKRSLISDIQHPETRPSRTLQEGFTASALIPITSQETVVGVINVATRKSPTFPRDQVALLEAIGAALGLALERARLHAEVTEHAETLEAKVQERTAALEEASRHKSEFLANMSHELRTPLNAVIGFAEVLEDQTFGPLNPKQTRYVQNIHSSGQHLLRLINDILDLSKVEAGKMELRPEEVGLRGALEEVAAAVKPLVEKKQVTLTVELQAGASALLADPGKVRQILYNLLSNAVKFTPEGGRIRVTGRPAPDPRFVALTVTDTGIGIAPADLSRLFQEFIQLDSSVAKQYQGTGLGLALTRKLVELHGGTIAVSSPGVGEGTTATVTLPRPISLSPPESETPDATALPVLVIEDDPKAINLLTLHLTQAGYQVAVARDASEALTAARTLQPFAITLDILMPGTDGWGILQALKTDPATREIPVIVVSIVDDQKLGLTLGALEYLVKPLKKEALLQILDRLILSPRGRAQPLKVLVVDDEPSVRELLRAILTPLGITVLTAEGGAEGLAMAKADQPDLLILDLMMPQMSGFEVVEALRADPATAQLPIVINTAKTLTVAEQAVLTRHVQGLVPKGGYAPAVLLREVAKVAKNHWGRGKA